MNAIVIYESLTGNTRKTAQMVAAQLAAAGVTATSCPTTAVNYAALSAADLVIVGGWVDGLFFIGQRPGRSGRLRGLPAMRGKRALVFCTYAIDQGKTIEKLTSIVEGLGAEVLGGLAIRRNDLEAGAEHLVRSALSLAKV